MRPIEQGEPQLPVRINQDIQQTDILGSNTSGSQTQDLAHSFEKTVRTFLRPDRRGYPQETTYLVEEYWDENRWGYGRQLKRAIFPNSSVLLSVNVTTGSRMLVAHPDGVHDVRIARRVRIDDKTTIYQWEPEDSRRMKGLIDAEHSTDKRLSLLLGFAAKTNLGGLIKVMDKRTGEEKIYEVEASFDGSFQNYNVETTVRELPEDPTKALPPGK